MCMQTDSGKQPMMLMGFKILDQAPFGRIFFASYYVNYDLHF
jgi:hypothetical protein